MIQIVLKCIWYIYFFKEYWPAAVLIITRKYLSDFFLASLFLFLKSGLLFPPIFFIHRSRKTPLNQVLSKRKGIFRPWLIVCLLWLHNNVKFMFIHKNCKVFSLNCIWIIDQNKIVVKRFLKIAETKRRNI